MKTTLLALLALTTAAYAAPPAQQKNQVPGYFRVQVGDLEITALFDGIFRMDPKVIKAKPADVQAAQDKHFVNMDGGIATSVNAFLINSGTKLILVDTGAGKCFGPGFGGVQANLKAAGYEPSQVDLVLITHLHADHLCGLLDDEGKRFYRNAEVRAGKADVDFWLDASNAAKAPKDLQGFFKMAQDALAPYQAEKKLNPFVPTDNLGEGIAIDTTAGHTPGHTTYRFTSKGQSILFWGDIAHNAPTQFPKPDIVLSFDNDNKTALAARKRIFAQVAKDKSWIAGPHITYPGIGHLRAEGKGYVWAPAQYLPIK